MLHTLRFQGYRAFKADVIPPDLVPCFNITITYVRYLLYRSGLVMGVVLIAIYFMRISTHTSTLLDSTIRAFMVTINPTLWFFLIIFYFIEIPHNLKMPVSLSHWFILCDDMYHLFSLVQLLNKKRKQ